MTSTPVADFRGQIVLRCTRCGEGLTSDDFFSLGLRMPDDGESREEYCEAELLDSVPHADCSRARQAS